MKTEQFANERKFEKAMNLLGDVQKQMPGDDSLKQEIKDYKDKHPVLL